MGTPHCLRIWHGQPARVAATSATAPRSSSGTRRSLRAGLEGLIGSTEADGRAASPAAVRTAFIYPGQGGAWVGMGASPLPNGAGGAGRAGSLRPVGAGGARSIAPRRPVWQARSGRRVARPSLGLPGGLRPRGGPHRALGEHRAPAHPGVGARCGRDRRGPGRGSGEPRRRVAARRRHRGPRIGAPGM